MRQNKSASRAMDLLLLLSKAEKGVSLAEISAQLEIPKSSAFELVYTLVDKGFVEQNDNSKCFSLGIKAFEVGYAYRAKMDLSQAARPYLRELSQKVSDTVFLAIENDGMIVYLDKFLGSSEVNSSCNIGSRNHMYYTGLGKALLAAYDENKAMAILNKYPKIQKTKTTITDVEKLLEDFKEIRKRGYSIDDRENSDLLFCVAAPIYSSDSKPIAAISIASLRIKKDSDEEHQMGKLINETALEISKKLGYSKNYLY